MVLRIRKRKKEEWCILYILVLPFAFFFLMNILHVPSLIKYTIDVAWMFLLLTLIANRFNFPDREVQKIRILVVVMFLCTFVGAIFARQSVFYYLWGFRNNFRFFVFFFACTWFLKAESVKQVMRLMDHLFIINFVVVLIQFFVLDIRRDYLGGIFGVEIGCNGYMNIFLVITSASYVLQYMNRKESMLACLLRCILALLIAAASELKMFFIEFFLILLLVSIATNFSMRKLWIVLAGTLCALVGVLLFSKIYPEFAEWFSLEAILSTASAESGYTGRGDINRLTTVPIILSRFLNSGSEVLFGLGLGNCDYASGIDFLTTPFYRAYEHLHYTWFQLAMVMLETGVVGMALNLLFFVMVLIGARKRQKAGTADPYFCQMAQIIAVMCPLWFVYNSALRSEAGYMAYFVLALPFIQRPAVQNQKKVISQND